MEFAGYIGGLLAFVIMTSIETRFLFKHKTLRGAVMNFFIMALLLRAIIMLPFQSLTIQEYTVLWVVAQAIGAWVAIRLYRKLKEICPSVEKPISQMDIPLHDETFNSVYAPDVTSLFMQYAEKKYGKAVVKTHVTFDERTNTVVFDASPIAQTLKQDYLSGKR